MPIEFMQMIGWALRMKGCRLKDLVTSPNLSLPCGELPFGRKAKHGRVRVSINGLTKTTHNKINIGRPWLGVRLWIKWNCVWLDHPFRYYPQNGSTADTHSALIQMPVSRSRVPSFNENVAKTKSGNEARRPEWHRADLGRRVGGLAG